MSSTFGRDVIEAMLGEPYEIKRLFSLKRMSAEEEKRLRAPLFGIVNSAGETRTSLPLQSGPFKSTALSTYTARRGRQ
jgi:hypothetical protein